MTPPSLSIIVFAYNEAENVAPILRELCEWLERYEPGAKLVIVDDGPPGGVPPWVQRTFAANHATRTFVAAGIYD